MDRISAKSNRFMTKINRTRWLGAIAATVLTSIPLSCVQAATYYIDTNNAAASDANNGAAASPWKSLYALNGRTLAPADTVIVKSGVYSMPTGGNWDLPAVNLGSSGTMGNPITIKSEVTYGAVLDGGGPTANAPIGTKGLSWIVWDGFEVKNTGPKGILVFTSDNVTVQNCKVSAVVQVAILGDNTDGIRVEASTNVTLRNNDISDIRSGVPNSWNGAGIKLYDVKNLIAENNRIHDIQGSAIYDKRGGNNNTYRYNLIENVYDTLVMNTGSDRSNGDIYFYNNVVRNVATLSQTDTEMDTNVFVYNNTYIGYGIMGVRVRSANLAHRYYFYNNIMMRNGALGGDFGDTVVVDPTLVGNLDFNVYPTNSPYFTIYQYLPNQASYNSIPAWSAAVRGFDAHSVAAVAPTFVNAAGGDYHLAAGSALKGFGRVGGVATGAAVDPGAYSTGTEVIGIRSASKVPAAPQVLSVQ